MNTLLGVQGKVGGHENKQASFQAPTSFPCILETELTKTFAPGIGCLTALPMIGSLEGDGEGSRDKNKLA